MNKSLIAYCILTVSLVGSIGPRGILPSLSAQDDTIKLLKKFYREKLNIRFNTVDAALRGREENNIKQAITSMRLIYRYMVDEAERKTNPNCIYHRLFAVAAVDSPAASAADWDKELVLIGGLLPNERISDLRSTTEKFTIFAPTNAATYAQRQRIRRLDDREEHKKLAQLANFHVVKGNISPDQLKDQSSVMSLNGLPLRIAQKSNQVFVEGAKILKSIECDNGTIHVMDSFLTPKLSIIETVVDYGECKTISSLLSKSELATQLQDPEPWTLFAPTDDAFESLPYRAVEFLQKPENKEIMQRLLSRQLFNSNVSSSRFQEQFDDEKYRKETLLITQKGDQVSTESFDVIKSDILCSNGTVHIVSSLHVPQDVQIKLDQWANTCLQAERTRLLNRNSRRTKKSSFAQQRELYDAQRLVQLKEKLDLPSTPIPTEWFQRQLGKSELSAQDLSVAKKLIQRLDANKFLARQSAEKSLMELPKLPVELLKESLKNADIEKAVRIRRILKNSPREATNKIEDILDLVRLAKPKGIAEPLLSTAMKYLDDQVVFRKVKQALLASVVEQDLPFLDSQVEPSTPEALQEISIIALGQIKNDSLADQFFKWSERDELSERIRLRSLIGLVNLGDRRALAPLLALMIESESPQIRAMSQHTLKQFSGQRFDYFPYAREEVRADQAVAWITWLEKESPNAKLNFPVYESKRNGHMLFVHWNKVIEFDEAMNEVWRFSVRSPDTAEIMDNGNILISSYDRNRVIEVTREKKVVREISVELPLSARPLENGNIIVTSNRLKSILEIDRQGKFAWQAFNREFFLDAIRLENGNTLAAESTTEVGFGHSYNIVEFDKAGQRVWERHTFSKYQPHIQQLRNGNVLIAQDKQVIEVDKKNDNVVWRVQIPHSKNDAFRMDNGNTLVGLSGEIIELDPSGKRVWTQKGSSQGRCIRQY